EVIIDNTIPEHLESLIAKLREMGVRVEQHNEQVLIAPKQSLKAVDIKTLVYPGFPTDLQHPFTALLTQATGASVVTDTIYPSRLKHIDELRRMNADMKVEGGSAIVRGPAKPQGARLKASDLRAGASLVIAGLLAKGQTEITRVDHIQRGYEQMSEKQACLGAHISEQKMTH